jgi:hypothetical protein
VSRSASGRRLSRAVFFLLTRGGMSWLRLWWGILGIRSFDRTVRGPSRPAKVESSLRRYHSSDIRRQTFDDSWTQCGSSDGQVTVRSTSSAARVSRRWRKRDFRNTVSDKQTQAYLRVESKPSGQTSRCWCGPKGSANCWARFEVPLVRREGCHDSWRRSGP